MGTEEIIHCRITGQHIRFFQQQYRVGGNALPVVTELCHRNFSAILKGGNNGIFIGPKVNFTDRQGQCDNDGHQPVSDHQQKAHRNPGLE